MKHQSNEPQPINKNDANIKTTNKRTSINQQRMKQKSKKSNNTCIINQMNISQSTYMNQNTENTNQTTTETSLRLAFMSQQEMRHNAQTTTKQQMQHQPNEHQ